jgi:glycine/D-amino acid oxidase-like deaminating enzyme
MTVEVRIVGQGLAGSLLGWACERAGISFTIEDRLPDPATSTEPFVSASSVGAGIINPITGQRLVKSWRIDALLPLAVAMYQEIGDVLGESFLFRYRLRRFFADEREGAVAREKWSRGDFAGFGQSLDDEGLWIDPAYRVDLDALVRALRARWQASGHWRDPRASPAVAAGLTVRAIGAAELGEDAFSWAKLIPAKGELLEIEMSQGALNSAVVLNRHEWLVPLSDSRALVGATFEPGISSFLPTETARNYLETVTTQLVGAMPFQTVSHRVGVRVVAPDKHPVIGRHPEKLHLGIFNALGSKGALLAPWLAHEWVMHLKSGRPVDREVEVGRFWK